MKRFVVLLALFPTSSLAQQIDFSKLATAYQQQRNINADGLAQCSVAVSDLQAKVAELEKKLADAATKADEGKKE